MSRRLTAIALWGVMCVLTINTAAGTEIGPRRITLPSENLAKEAYLTIPAGDWVAALSYEYEILGDARLGREPIDNTENSFTLNNTLALDISYGLSENITLNAIVPYKYVYNTRTVDSSLVAGTEGFLFDQRRGSQGLGDIILMSYVRIKFGDLVRFGDEYYPSGDDGYDEYIGDGPSYYAGRRQGPVFALALGARLPTGRTDVTDEIGRRLPDDLQLGTGTLSPVVGLLYHQRYFRLGWGVSAIYRFATKANIHHYEWGDEIVGAVYLGYRVNRNLEFVSQVNGTRLGRNLMYGEPIANRGGSVVFYTPSLTYVGAGAVTVQLSAEIPVYRDFIDRQLSSDYIINLRTALSFD